MSNKQYWLIIILLFAILSQQKMVDRQLSPAVPIVPNPRPIPVPMPSPIPYPVSIAVDDRAICNVDRFVKINVLANDITTSTNIEIIQRTIHGVILVENGLVIYRPNIGFIGMDRFSYVINNSIKSNEAIVHIEVQNKPPPWQ